MSSLDVLLGVLRYIIAKLQILRDLHIARDEKAAATGVEGAIALVEDLLTNLEQGEYHAGHPTSDAQSRTG
jgi:hypothetical protein